MSPKRSSRRLGPTVEGRRPVLEALRAGTPLRRILLVDSVERGRQIEEIVALARAAGVPVEEVSRRALDRDTETRRHQGVVAVALDPDYIDLGDLIAKSISAAEPALIAVLHCRSRLAPPGIRFMI